MDATRILYDYITGLYGNVVDFAEKSGIPSIDLTAVLLKENVFEEIRVGFDLCKLLNIDINELVFNNKIRELESEKNIYLSEKSREAAEARVQAAKTEIYNKCVRLSEIEKKKVLEYIDGILEEK